MLGITAAGFVVVLLENSETKAAPKNALFSRHVDRENISKSDQSIII